MPPLSSFIATCRIVAVLSWVSGTECKAAPAADKQSLPGDYLEQISNNPVELRLTLPNGMQVLGKIGELHRSGPAVDRLTGTIIHPEKGVFSFECPTDGNLKGRLCFEEKATEWRIASMVESKGFQWVEAPVEDAFRPRRVDLPKVAPSPHAPSRAEADADLKKGLKVEEIAPGKLRIGEVVLDKNTRSIRFPGVVNMHDGTVEYGIVTSTGKRHEALFSTTANPRDIHLAMLLLGVKPAACVEAPDRNLRIPDGSAVEVRAEWKVEDSEQNRPIHELITVAKTSTQMRKPSADVAGAWLYNGSKFNDAGFAANVEGSIVSLIADDFALINNAGSDRVNDEIHIPDSAALPKTDTPVTLIISLFPVSPKPKAP